MFNNSFLVLRKLITQLLPCIVSLVNILSDAKEITTYLCIGNKEKKEDILQVSKHLCFSCGFNCPQLLPLFNCETMARKITNKKKQQKNSCMLWWDIEIICGQGLQCSEHKWTEFWNSVSYRGLHFSAWTRHRVIHSVS